MSELKRTDAFFKRPCAPKAITYDDQRFASSDLDRGMAALKGFRAMLLEAINWTGLDN